VRSINTSIVGLLPVASLLFVGAYVLGAGTLKDLALALFVGIAVGTYSSIFVATPFLCQLKEREPAMQALAKRVQARRGGGRDATSKGAAGDVAGAAEEAAAGATSTMTQVRPSTTRGPRNQPKRKSKRKRSG
jgi:preprotein translocase subunit SecF